MRRYREAPGCTDQRGDIFPETGGEQVTSEFLLSVHRLNAVAPFSRS
jgi:hypothetical protein